MIVGVDERLEEPGHQIVEFVATQIRRSTDRAFDGGDGERRPAGDPLGEGEGHARGIVGDVGHETPALRRVGYPETPE